MRTAGILGVGIIALLALSGCEVQGPPIYGPGPGGPIYRPGPSGPGGSRACPRIYDPVCGERYGHRRNFPNSCEADSAGYRVVHNGQCRSNRPPPGGDRPDQSQRVCPMIYKPVCGRRGSSVRTFPNSCQAKGDGYRVIYRSECRGGRPDRDRDRDRDRDHGDRDRDRLESQRPANGQSCSRAYVPVCGERGGQKKTFLNACLAQSEGYRVADNGKCG